MNDINKIMEIIQLPEIDNPESRKNRKKTRIYNDIIRNILNPECIEEAFAYRNTIKTRIDGLRSAMQECIKNEWSCHPLMPETVRSAFIELNRWMAFYCYYVNYIKTHMLVNGKIPDDLKMPANKIREEYVDLVVQYSGIPTAVFTLYSKILEKSELTLCGTVSDITTIYYLTLNQMLREKTGEENAEAHDTAARTLETLFDEVNLRVCMKEEQSLTPSTITTILDYGHSMKYNSLLSFRQYDNYQKEINQYLSEKNPEVVIYLIQEAEIFGKELDRLHLISKDGCCNIYGAWATGNRYMVYRDDKKLRNEYIESTMRALHTNHQYGKTKLGLSYGFIRKIFADKRIQEKSNRTNAGETDEI